MARHVGEAFTSQVDDALLKFVPEGLKILANGYIDYAKDVVVSRALPDIDGFKPSQRRILYTMGYIEKVKEDDFTKCANIAGATMKLHPHGDATIYDTLVRMTDSSQFMNVPYIKGKGTFGRVYSTEPAAASRYTECTLMPITQELFRDMSGTLFVPSYDNKLKEPALLPSSFPNILCNPIQGIAVGLSCNIPAFNFHEVNNAVIEYLETGDIKTPLMPDYTTGGHYIKDDKELENLMNTGRAKLKFRGKWHIEGKLIVIDEIPYYTTTTEIMRQISEIKNISDVRDESDRGGLKLAIECVNKASVESVLTDVLRESSLQMQMSTNIVIIIDNAPRVIGVKEIIRNWIEFRKSVLSKTLQTDLDNVRVQIERYNLLLDLLMNNEKRDTFIKHLMTGRAKAITYLNSIYPEYKGSLSWVVSMTLDSFFEIESKKKKLAGYLQEEETLIGDLEDINRVIIRQLKEINEKYSFPRRTEPTDVDYVFEKGTEVIKPTPVPVIIVNEGKFIKKILANQSTVLVEGLRCMSDDVLSFADNHGRLLRVHLENLEVCKETDKGVYMPMFLGIDDDFEIVFWDLIKDKTVGYVYSDGYASVIDYSEWLDAKRCTKVTYNGTSDKVNLIIQEIDFSKPYVMVVTEQGELGFAKTDFKQKSRTARTKLIDIKKDDKISTVLGVTDEQVLELISNPEKYIGKVSKVRKGDTFNTELYAELLQKR